MYFKYNPFLINTQNNPLKIHEFNNKEIEKFFQMY
jgi:hypothetical protein